MAALTTAPRSVEHVWSLVYASRCLDISGEKITALEGMLPYLCCVQWDADTG
jgi:hypothetical protein